MMHKARAFILVCAGILLLALVSHLGATNAGAQKDADAKAGLTSPVGVPSPANCTVPASLVMSPGGDIPFTVTIRDIGNSPVAGSNVELDCSNCPGFTFCPGFTCCSISPCPGCLLDETQTLCATTDLLGQASFLIRGGGVCGPPYGVRINADGMFLGSSSLASVDQNGDLLVDATDVASVETKVGTTDPTADIDNSGMVTAADVKAVEDKKGTICPPKPPDPPAFRVTLLPWGNHTHEVFVPENPPKMCTCCKPPIQIVALSKAQNTWVPDVVPYPDGNTWIYRRKSDNRFVVKRVPGIIVSGHTTIYLPVPPPTGVEAHEEAHDGLNKEEYDRNAKVKYEAAIREFLKMEMEFVAEGATDAEKLESLAAQAEAKLRPFLDAAGKLVAKQALDRGEAFDKTNKHGTSGSTAEQDAAKINELFDKAPPAGEQKKPADPVKEKGSTEQGMYFDGASEQVAVGSSLIETATNASDPIIGRGRVVLDSLGLIGVLSNGTTLLADTHLQIVDDANGDALLDGYLIQVAYMPSVRPGDAGMIQGYLAILPPSVPGINNTIGSEFLTGMQAASDADDLTMVWIYATALLFDSTSACLIPPEGVPVTVELGVGMSSAPAVVEPARLAPARLTAFPQPGLGTMHFAWSPVGVPADFEIFDVSGARHWRARLNGASGEYVWPGTGESGELLPAGVYFARLRGRGMELSSRIVLMR